MKGNKRLLALLCALALTVGLVPAAVAAPDTATLSATHTVWVVGDSTVSAFNDSYYYPRYGYGTQIGNYIDSTYEVQNKAASGRSSISYAHVPEAQKGSKETYEAVMAGIKSGDILVVGFGHNDEKAEPERYTDPNGDWQTEGSFANSLWVNYVQPAQAKGAEVILCTPVVRVPAQGKTDWANSELHITNTAEVDGTTYPGGNYPDAVRQLGQDKNVAVADLTAATKALYEKVGFEEALNFHAWTSSKIASVDKTHLNIYGAKMVAWLFANAVKDGQLTALAEHIDLAKGEPTKAADLVSNPNYKETDYTSPTVGSTVWPSYGLFQPTAFGDIGTDSPGPSSYLMETDTDGNVHMKGTGKGKVGGSVDGIMMYYCPVPVGSTFSITATATINGFSSGASTTTLPNQSGFGLMARDDMWIDKKDTTITSDYVVAGSCANSGGPCGSFYRKDAKVSRTSLTTETVEKGKSFDLSIVYNGDGYACTFGEEPTQSGGFDFQLTTVDSEYVYVGMFATREVDVTFSNIILTVDGRVVMNSNDDTFSLAVAEDDAWTVEDGALKSIQCDLGGNATLSKVLVATYNARGAMTGVKPVTLVGEKIPVDLPLAAGETARVFALGKHNLAPWCAAASYTVPSAPAE